jgi:hypothetical protein
LYVEVRLCLRVYSNECVYVGILVSLGEEEDDG